MDLSVKFQQLLTSKTNKQNNNTTKHNQTLVIYLEGNTASLFKELRQVIEIV